MRTTSSVLLGVLTAAFIGGANAQDSDKKDIDWKKVDETLGRTAAVSGDVHRYALSAHRPAGDARWRHHQAGVGPRQLGGVQADAGRGDGDG